MWYVVWFENDSESSEMLARLGDVLGNPLKLLLLESEQTSAFGCLKGLLTKPAGGLQTLFEVGATVMIELMAVIILPMMFVLLGNPVSNSMSFVLERVPGWLLRIYCPICRNIHSNRCSAMVT